MHNYENTKKNSITNKFSYNAFFRVFIMMYLKKALLYNYIVYNNYIYGFFCVFIIMYLKNAEHALFSHFRSHLFPYSFFSTE